ncbi:MAG: hypothetical protein ACTSU5_10085 [Promethearchaeota archaeon]
MKVQKVEGLSKTLHTEIKGVLATRFERIKASLGIQSDAEVVRYLVQQYFREHLEREEKSAWSEVEADAEIIARFMDKYGPEWRKLGE